MIPYDLLKVKYLKTEDQNNEINFTKLFISKWQYYEKSQYSHSNLNFNDHFDIFINSNQNSFPHIHLNNLSIESLNPNYNDVSVYYSLSSQTFNDSNQINNYFYLRKLTFISFFINNMIDVPICFKKSKSLKFKTFELPLLKFSNFLMKKGKREKITRLLFQTMRFFFLSQNNKNYGNNSLTNWLTFYLLFNNLFLNYESSIKNNTFFFDIHSNPQYSFSSFMTNEDNFTNQDSFLKNFVLNQLSQVSPVFSYFIYSVDKNIRKFSRGKSGKYTFVWKYVAPYKRLYLAMRLIAKDIKFFNSKKLNERVEKTFYILNTNIQKSLLWKSKIFSHNYVFKNFKKSLMSSLRTSS